MAFALTHTTENKGWIGLSAVNGIIPYKIPPPRQEKTKGRENYRELYD
jgi:hypothetical protein